jgi:hypothetical protein
MVIVISAGQTCKEYEALRVAGQVDWPRLCPTCGGYLTIHAWKDRIVKTESQEIGEARATPEHILVPKLCCSNPDCPQPCHTALPSFIPPQKQFMQVVRQQALDLVEAGATLYAICQRLKLFAGTLKYWLWKVAQVAPELTGRLWGVARRHETEAPLPASSAGCAPWASIRLAAQALLGALRRRNLDLPLDPSRLLEFVAVVISQQRWPLRC